jgi:hypothetical protein
MAANRILTAAACAFLAGLLIVTAPLAWDFTARRRLEVEVWQTLTPDVAEMYEPSGVIQLERRDSTIVDLTGRACVDGLIYMTFSSARPKAELQADYHQGLTADGWLVEPGLESGDDFFVYKRGPNQLLRLKFKSAQPSPAPGDYPTVYTLSLDYTLLDQHTCFEDGPH